MASLRPSKTRVERGGVYHKPMLLNMSRSWGRRDHRQAPEASHQRKAAKAVGAAAQGTTKLNADTDQISADQSRRGLAAWTSTRRANASIEANFRFLGFREYVHTAA
ncbi:hypothetical protein CCMA1212_006552 [Trichoderma ghanense]|uniref:Uncharacterized protein n=1 Tax=Trichoderma ghanense TaxID=65468 RepID=A0ABY2H2E5_9HYPO